jgi:polysaccharide deacetylase family protein (PEP-CTERM system associated)
VIEDAAGEPVRGYRAPSYSITARSLWALDVLVEEGITYDSSIFPIHHDFYGIPDAPREPFTVQTASGPLREYPVTTFRMGAPHNFPVGGGGYLRILPFWYTRLGMARALSEGVPLIVYIHPWEVDPEQPRVAAPLRSRFRHYTNLRKTAARLHRVLASASFDSFRESGLLEAAAPTVALGGRIGA